MPTRSTKILLGLFAIFASAFFVANSASAATYYSNSSTGNDTTGDGSSGNPYLTFHKAYTVAASSGDTINLTGTFTWTDAGETGDAATTGYTLAKSLTITGQSASSTIIQAHATTDTADRNVFTIGSGKTVVINNVTIRNGKATSSGGVQGGAITLAGTLTINNSIITANRYTYAGNGYYSAGAIFVDQTGVLTVDKSTISNNVWTSKYYGSGGIYVSQSGTVTVTNSTISGNTATSSNPTDFSYSYAEPSGAFGSFRFATNVFTNVTITGNSTNSYSGAMQLYYTTSTTITNCTITNNTGSAGTGGILYESLADGHRLYLKNTILADNTGASSTASDFYAYDVASAGSGRLNDNGYNIVEYSTNKTWSGTGNITGNQASLNISSSLADNNTLYGPYTLALSSGSVAIDAGSAAAANGAISVPTADERGGTRSSTTDIGAYEYNGGGLVVQYTLTYSANANGSLTGTTSQTVNAGADGSAVTAVPATGYSFTSWSDASTANPRTDTAVSGNITVSASFALNTYTLTYTAGANGSITGTSPQTVNHGSDGSAVTAVADTGYTFASWSDASTDNPRTDSAVTSNISVTATFSDSASPTISGLTPSVSGSSVTIEWATNENSSSIVEYGKTSSYGTTTDEADTSPRVSSHTVSISDLTNCTIYYFRVKSTDSASNQGVSSESNFRTGNCGGGRPPVIPRAPAPVPAVTKSPVIVNGISTSNVATSSNTNENNVVSGLVNFAFKTDLKPRQENFDTRQLQNFLSMHGEVYPEKIISGYYGPKTRQAVIRFQEKYSEDILAPLGLTEGTGFVGEYTRKKLNELLLNEEQFSVSSEKVGLSQ